MLWLSSTIRDVHDANELRSMVASDQVKFELANLTLKRTHLQLIIMVVLWVWVSYLNYNMFGQQTQVQQPQTQELEFAKIILATLFIYCSTGATLLIAGGLRDWMYGNAVANNFPASAHAGGVHNLRYFFGGLAMLVTGSFFYNHVRHKLPWDNTLVFLAEQGLVTVLVITQLRDRIDATRAENEGGKQN